MLNCLKPFKNNDMKKLCVLILFCSCYCSVYSQVSYSQEQIEMKCDSIIKEADKIYRYEASTWTFSDRAVAIDDVRKNFKGMFVYEEGDVVKCIAVNADNQCIYEESFLPANNQPYSIKNEQRELTEKEKTLRNIRAKVFAAISDNKWVTVYDGFPVNPILIPFDGGYKFYLICSSSKGGVVPWGNDYLFLTDAEGKVESWKKFHSRMIPMDICNETPIMTHSHLRTEPFISATDICTFNLYRTPNMDRFCVYSPGLSLYFTYLVGSNSIKVDKEPYKEKILAD